MLGPCTHHSSSGQPGSLSARWGGELCDLYSWPRSGDSETQQFTFSKKDPSCTEAESEQSLLFLPGLLRKQNRLSSHRTRALIWAIRVPPPGMWNLLGKTVGSDFSAAQSWRQWRPTRWLGASTLRIGFFNSPNPTKKPSPYYCSVCFFACISCGDFWMQRQQQQTLLPWSSFLWWPFLSVNLAGSRWPLPPVHTPNEGNPRCAGGTTASLEQPHPAHPNFPKNAWQYGRLLNFPSNMGWRF